MDNNINESDLPTAIDAPTAPVTGTKTAGFLTGKMVITIAAVVVLGGGIALGYTVFPQQFYNTVGKYIGLPTPNVSQEPMRGSSDETAATDVSGTTTVDSTLDDINIYDVMPGADANVLFSFKTSDKTTSAVNEIIAAGTSTDALTEEELNAIKSIKQIVFAAKIDSAAATQKTREFMGSQEQILPKVDFPAAVGIKADSEFIQLIVDKLEAKIDATAPNEVKIETNGDFITLQNLTGDVLQGKLSENPMFATIQNTDSDFILAGDLSEFADQAVAEEEATSTEELAKNPMKAQQLALQKNIRYGAILGSIKENDGKLDLSIRIMITMNDDMSAADLVNMITTSLEQLKTFVPPEYQSFLTTNTGAENTTANVEISIKDIMGLKQKIDAAALEAKQNIEFTPMPSSDENAGPSRLPIGTDSNTPKTNVKVPRPKN
jgi:hypothetical protein